MVSILLSSQFRRCSSKSNYRQQTLVSLPSRYLSYGFNFSHPPRGPLPPPPAPACTRTQHLARLSEQSLCASLWFFTIEIENPRLPKFLRIFNLHIKNQFDSPSNILPRGLPFLTPPPGAFPGPPIQVGALIPFRQLVHAPLHSTLV